MMEPKTLRLSALGRDVRVGDHYNYFTGGIRHKDGGQMINESVQMEQKPNTEVKCDILLGQLDIASKRRMVGINTNLYHNIQGGYIDWKQLWFADYIAPEPPERKDDVALVTIFFRVVRRTETLDQIYLNSKMEEYQKMGDGLSTHLVEQVVFGAEIICSIQRTIDLENKETKEMAENCLYLAAKKYLNNVDDPSSDWNEAPTELDNVSYSILSSLDYDNQKINSFLQFSQYLRAIATNNAENDKPIEIALRYMPCPLENRLLSDRCNDIKIEIELNWLMFKETSRRLSNYPFLNRVPQLATVFDQFCKLLEPAISDFIQKNSSNQQEQEIVANLMASIKIWLKLRRDEIETVFSLLKDCQLDVLDSETISKARSKAQATSCDENCAKVFVLRFDYVEDEMMTWIQKTVANLESTFMLPIFKVTRSGNHHFEKVSNSLKDFAKKAELSGLNLSPDQGTSYYIGLLLSDSSSPFDDGDTMTINKDLIEETSQSSATEALRKDEIKNSAAPTDTTSQKTDDTFNNMSQKFHGESQIDDLDNETEQTSERKESTNVVRIAEVFKHESNGYSQLIKSIQPEVYMLNTRQSSSSTDLQWLDIGRLDGVQPTFGLVNHKVIILMGATGSGKSTLINGMVNYILGVQWKDSFRFKCVQEDESTRRNQAHSQTSSVTAYTIHHHEGMAVPYSITIIDTPGYGDTRGVARDKEITRRIHQFLMQKDARISKIHAACFVAAAGDSRLTVTQRYILDSVLSIFGKDFKSNIRLLATFADNADPPVVEACRATHFPTSASGVITYSKFNSSVLYASNTQKEEEEFSFDELFWDMGQENFANFFKMLEGMDGRDLSSTREVILQRQQVEQSLKEIEQEIETSLAHIESMEMFKKRMLQYAHSMAANKNYVIEKTEIHVKQVYYNDKEHCAYNCRQCNKTCAARLEQSQLKQIYHAKQCPNENCQCPDSKHFFEPFELQQNVKKVQTTLKDMKFEYESNFSDKLTTEECLAKCSHDLKNTKAKVLQLLHELSCKVQSLESMALHSNTLSPSDYLSLMRSRVAEEQKPGYLTRLQTLNELEQESITTNTMAEQTHPPSVSKLATPSINGVVRSSSQASVISPRKELKSDGSSFWSNWVPNFMKGSSQANPLSRQQN